MVNRTVAWLHDAAIGRRFVLEGTDVPMNGSDGEYWSGGAA